MSFKNTPPNVSTKLTFPCTECNFEAQSARQLSRHKAVTHTQNALKCVLCPFVTAYQTNLLRHRKDVHGICGSKGNKSCKFCGFVSEDNDTLIQHQIEYHQDILKSAQAKFAKELLSAAGEENKKDFTASFETMTEEIKNKTTNHSGKKRTKIIIKRNWNQVETNKLNNLKQDDDEAFWKAGFIDQYEDHSNLIGQMMNADIHNESMPTSRSSTPKSQSSHVNSNKNDLPATRIRRQYNCNDCGISTTNPRQFLYHRRDTHGYKLKIVECPYCVYACQYVQKLQRHLLLVHKLTSVMNLPNETLTGNNSIELDNLKRKFKKSRLECSDGNIHLDNDDEQGTHQENNSQDNLLNEQDYEQMNFEMNLNEYSNNEDDDMEGNINDEKKFLVNLECSICKIKFGNAVSAQKHFIKHHKHSNFKNIINIIKANNNLILGSTNQKKVFDSSAKNIHVCKFCGYKTRWISELERHIRVHSKEKPFKCVFCDFRSKWKGDLNRHIQRYHSNEQALPDLESDNSINGNMNNMSPNEQDDELINDDSLMNEENELFMEMDDNAYCKNIDSNENSDEFENENDIPVFNGNTAKMYKCTHCDFMCSTASRFHVHYVQHLNTKPFQCSICGHRSNWEWDVTKHIKMKAQRDPSHIKARPVLIHDSGKRDYSKYNRFVVWVGQEEAEVVNENNKIDFRAKRFKTELDDLTNDNGMDVLTPEVCFEVDGEANNINYSNEQNFNITNDLPLTPSKKYIVKSVIISRHSNSQSKLIKCNHCEFRHHFARVMVAHMSSHNRTKPYSCKQCSFETNWREVIINHYINNHKNTDPNDFEMRFRCVVDENCICRILSKDEVAQIETNNELVDNNPANNVSNISSLIEPNIYEEKAVIRCELCPFITTNLKKMSIHCRFHNQSKGCLKCKYCPYYVNNHEKLMRHQKLHQKIELINNCTSYIDNSNESTNDTSNYSNNSKRSLIQCSICLFQTYNMQLFSDHMNACHINGDNNNDNDYDIGEMNNNIEQTFTENDVYGNNHDYMNTNIDNEYGENSLSLVDVNKNNGKKYSYTCPDCPAAFKSSGDYKIHAVFHSTNYQHSCPYCTYKAKNKPQLGKHLYVHTAEYGAKWANSDAGTKLFLDNKGHSNFTAEQTAALLTKQILQQQQKSSKKSIRKHRTKIEFPMKPVKVKLNSEENGKQNIVFNNTDLMSEQEFLETKEYLQRINSGIKNRCMYRCSKCPAVFTKVNTLIYHSALHEENGPFTCDACNYSTKSKDNLSIHSLLHNLKESQAALGYNFNYNCHKCPAGFSKRTRLDKHLSLHGAKFNWKCGNCDYSVRYAATLVKHQALHLVNPDFQAMEYSNDNNKETNNEESFNADDSAAPTTTSTDESLKLKFNLSNIREKMSNENNYDIPMDSNDENIAENNSNQENYENEYDINPVLIMEEGED